MNLTSAITDHFRITPVQKAALKKLGIGTIEDLLYHFPVRYGDTAEARSIDSLRRGDTAVIYGKIGGLKTAKGFHSRIAMADGYVEDETGRIQCVWFNQPYVAKMFSDGMLVRIEGKVSQRKAKGQSSKAKTVPIGFPTDENIAVTARGGTALSVTTAVAAGNGSVVRGGVADDERAGSLPLPGGHGDVEAAATPESAGVLYFSNPKIETVDKLPIGVGDSLFGDGGEAHTLYPVYPESRGTSSSWLYHAIQKVFRSGLLDSIPEPIPADILEKYHLPGVKTALIWIHTPLKNEDALSARKRFSFEEIFTIQLGKQQARKEYAEHPSFALETDIAQVHEFVRRFPFKATEAQIGAIEAICADMKRDRAMSRLLEGDVGSGKTAVAAATAYAVITSHMHERARIEKETAEGKAAAAVPKTGPLQIAYMCPTEILAGQHFESFIQYFSYMPIQIALITGSGCRKFPSKVNPKGWTDISRAQLLKWVANGEIAVVIGTHALIQKSVEFKNLAFAIIDEQHRFGTAQRAKLVKKNTAPHLLSMSATPIPRTLALTLYGDLDLTVLDQSPAGRKPIVTELVLPAKRAETYEKIRQELKAGRQMYVICPRIDEPDPDKEAAVIAKSVKEEAKRLKQSVFQDYEIGVLHGKMRPDEKDSVMADFKAGKIDILCATSVVEVGVNVPNATVIIIEGAERFGLAQLHQLRGRVMRSSEQAYCYAFTETSSSKSIERLKALQSAKNGFELAELDLAQRGAGELSGMRQWGVSDIAMDALKNLKMVEAARTEAVRLIDEDAKLSKYPILKKKVEAHNKDSHFE